MTEATQEVELTELETEKELALARFNQLAKLRMPFPPTCVDTVPKPTRKDGIKGKCNDCGRWHRLPAIHLSYVGHAYVTERLLEVDPFWNWEPCAEVDGRPRFEFDSNGNLRGLWIKLTICGVTRRGFGSIEAGVFDPEKQLIGDAIRNAAMRFGVALEMWTKSGEDDATQNSKGRVSGEAAEDVKPASSTFPLNPKTKGDRVINGIPITVAASWNDIEHEKLGGKGKYQHLTWGELIDPQASDDRVSYLTNFLQAKAQENWDKLGVNDKALGKSILPVYQNVLIALQEYQERMEASPTVDL
jgi:hypothetical protein